MTDRLLEGKIALVTGGTSGIGRATAVIMGRHGAAVIIAGRREEQGEETAALVRETGAQAEFVRTDVTVPAEVSALVGHAISKYGRLDCAFNNAGTLIDTGKLHETDDSVFDQTMNVNVRGVWLCMKEQLKVMVGQGCGAIVNDSSSNGVRASLNRPAYITSKHAVVGLTRSAALDYARNGIRVNAICPGPIDTEMMVLIDHGDAESRRRIERAVPLGRYGTADEVGEIAAWLCSDAASYVTGQAFSVDGGMTSR